MLGTWQYGNHEIDLDRLPEAVQVSFIRRTISHVLGNEVAAALLRVQEKFKADTGVDMDEDESESERDRMQAEKIQKFYDGTVGLRVGGPRGNTIENIAWELAYKQAEATLAPKGAWPKADRKNGIKAEDAVIKFAGELRNREQLTDMVLEKYNADLMEKAKAVHAERMAKAKANKAAAIPAKSTVEQSAEDLI